MANRRKNDEEAARYSLQVYVNHDENEFINSLVDSRTSRSMIGRNLLVKGLGAPKIVGTLYECVPCGPWEELGETLNLAVDDSFAVALGYKPGDFFALTDGCSMVEFGIPDKSIVMLRPGLMAGAGDVVLYEAELPDGRRVGTLKRHGLDHEGVLRIRDGVGDIVEMPFDAVELRIAGVKRGLVSRG